MRIMVLCVVTPYISEKDQKYSVLLEDGKVSQTRNQKKHRLTIAFAGLLMVYTSTLKTETR
jgi:hypothetical protein